MKEGMLVSDDLTITVEQGYLHVTFSGMFDLVAARRSVDRMVDACVEEDCDNVLFDCRSMSGDISVMDRFSMGKYGGEHINPDIRIAMLGHRRHILPDKFFENVAHNRGIQMKLFSDIEEAIAWLKE